MVQTDMVIKDTVETFYIYRTYQSVHENKGGLLGSRWYLNIGSWLYAKEDRATVILPDMHLERFTRKGDEWENDHNGDRSVWLKENRDGYSLIIMKERKEYHYSREGQLLRITDRNGNSIWMRYVGKTTTGRATAREPVMCVWHRKKMDRGIPTTEISWSAYGRTGIGRLLILI